MEIETHQWLKRVTNIIFKNRALPSRNLRLRPLQAALDEYSRCRSQMCKRGDLVDPVMWILQAGLTAG